MVWPEVLEGVFEKEEWFLLPLRSLDWEFWRREVELTGWPYVFGCGVSSVFSCIIMGREEKEEL
jgi:hypothetical protein